MPEKKTRLLLLQPFGSTYRSSSIALGEKTVNGSVDSRPSYVTKLVGVDHLLHKII